MATDVPDWTGLFDLFRIGIGPSSSHTVGPMVAAGRFLAEIPPDLAVQGIGVELFGSLALTGKGHATDTAVILGLLGERPDQVDPDAVPGLVAAVAARKRLDLAGGRAAAFDPATDIRFVRTMLPRHPNALRLTATAAEGSFARTYCSVGGGFIVTDGEVPAEERATFRGQLVKGTAGQLQEGLVDLVVADVERRTAAFDRDAKLAEIRRRLKDPRKRHAALVHAAGVVLADGVLALDEVAFLRRASAALGEREAAAEEIIAEARAAR